MHLAVKNGDRYFDHDADIGIIGRGETIEQSFIDAAHALFSIMTDVDKVHCLQVITFEFEEADIELAFVTWLNYLITKSHTHHLMFSDFRLKRSGNIWQATVGGEPWNDQLERGTEVKGATLTMLSVRKVNHHWEAKCVVDV